MNNELELLRIDDEQDRQKTLQLMDLQNKLELEVALIQTSLKELETKAKNNKELLLALFQKYNIKSLETLNYKFTRIDETSRVSVDSKKLKEVYPQIYQECSKVSKVSANIRITAKKGSDEND